MRILIVDDEPGLARGLARWLTEHGWDAPGTAGTSDEAVDWINAHGGVDVLVCDVALQPADGFTLRETIQPHLPDMRTIFISGYDLSQYARRVNGCQILTKPLTGAALDAALRRLTSAPPPAAAVVARPVAATPRVPGSQPRPAAVVAAGSTPPAAPRVAVAASVAQPELPPDDLVGTNVGHYRIEALIARGTWGPVYRAMQTNMDRPVRFCTLDRQRAGDPAEVARFMASASVKANVQHPSIFAVYEAGESGGVHFFSCEHVPCRSLRQIRESGQFLDEPTALKVLQVAADVLGYLAREGTAHNRLAEDTVLVGPNHQPYIANVAVGEAREENDPSAEMRNLGALVATVLATDTPSFGVRGFCQSLANGNPAFNSWPALAEALAALGPKAAPQDSHKLDAQERVTQAFLEMAKKRRKRGMLVNSLVSLSVLALALWTIWWVWLRPKGGDMRRFDGQIQIPAGDFIYQNGEKATLPAFSIDAYEVTIGQYAQFLDYLEKHPEEEAQFAHSSQPKGKSHVPTGWADQQTPSGVMPGYYQRARRWGRYQEAPLDVNNPVFGVDWYDAHAYAKWKKRRLPTEQEWEKAARGPNGNLYPWGNVADEKKLNSGSDANPNPKQGGEIDGHDRTSPVDAKGQDRSPYGVQGMAGNVGEWTATFVPDPKLPGQQVPVIRGGNWRTPDYLLTRRILVLSAHQSSDALGFRTAADATPNSP